MALRFVDSFAHYTAAAGLTSKYNNVLGSWSVPVAGGRSGGMAARTNGFACWLRKTLDAQTTWVIGARIQVPNFNGGVLFHVIDVGTVQVELRWNADGTISAFRGGGGGAVLLGTGHLPLVVGAWAYLELRVTINSATGAVHTRINGQEDIALTGVDTSATGNATADVIGLGYDGIIGLQPNTFFGDLYVCDGTGTKNNDFLGDVRVEAVLPNGAGNYTDWTAVGQPTNWQAVSQNPPVPGTDYVESATPGDKDSYAHAAAGAGVSIGAVYGVSVTIDGEKDDAGTRQIAGLMRLAGTDAQGPTYSLGTSPVMVEDIHEEDPSGSDWTIANVNAAEIGVVEVS